MPWRQSSTGSHRRSGRATAVSSATPVGGQPDSGRSRSRSWPFLGRAERLVVPGLQVSVAEDAAQLLASGGQHPASDAEAVPLTCFLEHGGPETCLGYGTAPADALGLDLFRPRAVEKLGVETGAGCILSPLGQPR